MQWLTALLILASFNSAWAHGEEKPGPHGGYLRMPGNYHTEIIDDTKHSLKVYLTDIEWKNPVVKDSSVEVFHKTKKTTPAICKPEADYFICTFPNRIDLSKKGRVEIKSKRDGQQGAIAVYNLPLKFDNVSGGSH